MFDFKARRILPVGAGLAGDAAASKLSSLSLGGAGVEVTDNMLDYAFDAFADDMASGPRRAGDSAFAPGADTAYLAAAPAGATTATDPTEALEDADPSDSDAMLLQALAEHAQRGSTKLSLSRPKRTAVSTFVDPRAMRGSGTAASAGAAAVAPAPALLDAPTSVPAAFNEPSASSLPAIDWAALGLGHAFGVTAGALRSRTASAGSGASLGGHASDRAGTGSVCASPHATASQSAYSSDESDDSDDGTSITGDAASEGHQSQSSRAHLAHHRRPRSRRRLRTSLDGAAVPVRVRSVPGSVAHSTNLSTHTAPADAAAVIANSKVMLGMLAAATASPRTSAILSHPSCCDMRPALQTIPRSVSFLTSSQQCPSNSRFSTPALSRQLSCLAVAMLPMAATTSRLRATPLNLPMGMGRGMGMLRAGTAVLVLTRARMPMTLPMLVCHA